jgi:hypothetical protein
MNKKEILIPFVFIGLSAAFVFICAMVYFSGGKSKKWIARKMWIGGLLLTMTSFSCNNNTEVKCYDTVVSNYMGICDEYGKEIEINVDTSNVLKGYITGRYGKDFSFSISTNQGKLVQKDFVVPADSAFDTNNEDFKIAIDQNISPGKYQLKLYAATPKSQDTTQSSNEFQLIIKHKK